jgi:Bacterial Ig-like domain
VTLSGTVSGLAASATFLIAVSDGAFAKTYTATVNGAGTGCSATIPSADATTLADGASTLKVTAQVTDQYDNQSALATQTFTVDETPPTLTINTIAGDGVLNALEAQSNLTIGGTTLGVENGHHVTVTLNGHSYDAAVTSNAWTAIVPKADLTHAKLADGWYTVTANVSDAAGNPATAATQTLKVDETPPTLTISATNVP